MWINWSGSKKLGFGILLVSVLSVIAACGEKVGVSLLGSPSVSSSVTLNNPGNIYQGGQYTFSGTCAPNGTTVTIHLTSATPSQISNCNCNGGSFSCAPTTLTSVPTPSLNIEAQNSSGETDQVVVTSAIPTIALDDPGYFTSGDTITFTGSCSPDDLEVDINLTSSTPSSIQNCTCTSGSFSCPATLLSSLSTPSLSIVASNFPGSSSSQTVFTNPVAYATPATTPMGYGTSMTMALDLTGPSSLPGDQVSISSTCYNGGSCNFGSYNPPANTVGNFSLLGFSFLTSAIFPSDNSPPYLDVVGGDNRTLTIDFGASPQSLDTSGSKYYFWIAMAGMGSSPEFVTVTSNRSLQVIGYQDSFSNGDYAYLDGAATSLGSVGVAVTTKPASGANGYTFYLIQDRTVSTIQLSYVHGATPDPHGFILGAIEIRDQ